MASLSNWWWADATQQLSRLLTVCHKTVKSYKQRQRATFQHYMPLIRKSLNDVWNSVSEHSTNYFEDIQFLTFYRCMVLHDTSPQLRDVSQSTDAMLAAASANIISKCCCSIFHRWAYWCGKTTAARPDTDAPMNFQSSLAFILTFKCRQTFQHGKKRWDRVKVNIVKCKWTQILTPRKIMTAAERVDIQDRSQISTSAATLKGIAWSLVNTEGSWRQQQPRQSAVSAEGRAWPIAGCW